MHSRDVGAGQTCALDLRKSILLHSVCRIGDVKGTIRCHIHVNGRAYRGIVAMSTTPGLILPVLGWAMGRRMVVVLVLGFTTLLTSQVISVAFYSQRVKSDKFCSEALISAWGSFTCRKSTTRDPRLYFPSEGSHTQDFYALKATGSYRTYLSLVKLTVFRIQWQVW